MRRKGSHFKQTKQKHICDPGMCDHCIYIGEGDFLCDHPKLSDGGKPVLVVSDWQNTAAYMACKYASRNQEAKHRG